MQLFARRLRHNIDAAIERVRGVGQAQFRPSAAKERHERLLEIAVEHLKLRFELRLHFAEQLINDALQIQLRLHQIIALCAHLLVALHGLAVLVHRRHVYRTHLLDARTDGGHPLFAFAQLEIRRAEFLRQRIRQLVFLPNARG